MNPILIAGGDGFIGKKLTEEFLRRKIPVLVIDNHITSTPKNYLDPIFSRIVCDVANLDRYSIPKVSGVVHLASIASPLIYKEFPEMVIKSNTIGTQILMEIAKRDQVRFLFASTSEVYGDLLPEKKGGGISENDISRSRLLTKRSCYSTSKKMGEELVFNFKRNGGDGTNLRLFNIYGPGMDLKNPGYGRVIPNFINQISQDQKVTIFGNGLQERSFLWIEDAVKAIVNLLFYKGSLPPAVNIGHEETISINNLAKKIANILGKQYSTINFDLDVGDPLWRKPNIQLIKELIAWEPQRSLEEGLKKIISPKLSTGI